MIRAVIFDIDNVLVSTSELHYEAFNQALEENGLDKISKPEYKKYYEGLSTRAKLKQLAVNDLLVEDIVKSKQKLTKELINTYILPDIAKLELLDRLSKEGLSIGVCSSSIRSTSKLLLELAQIDKYVNHLVCSCDVFSPKPSPEGYRRLINLLECPLDTLVALEASSFGIQAAEAAGVRVIKINKPEEVCLNLVEKIFNI